MRKISLLGLLAACILGMYGCSAKIPTDVYTPQGATLYENNNPIDIGGFVYEPIKTLGMEPNQIQNTAIGSVYLSTSVAEMVRNITMLELQKSGMSIDYNTDLVVSGDILEFKADDVGYTVHWTYAVHYKISRKNTNEVLFSRNYSPQMLITRKLFASPATIGGFAQKVVSDAFELFVKDPDVREILDASAPNVP